MDTTLKPRTFAVRPHELPAALALIYRAELRVARRADGRAVRTRLALRAGAAGVALAATGAAMAHGHTPEAFLGIATALLITAAPLVLTILPGWIAWITTDRRASPSPTPTLSASALGTSTLLRRASSKIPWPNTSTSTPRPSGLRPRISTESLNPGHPSDKLTAVPLHGYPPPAPGFVARGRPCDTPDDTAATPRKTQQPPRKRVPDLRRGGSRSRKRPQQRPRSSSSPAPRIPRRAGCPGRR